MSEKREGFLRPGLKTGAENGIFWFEIGYGFGGAGGTRPPKIPRSTPRVIYFAKLSPGLYKNQQNPSTSTYKS